MDNVIEMPHVSEIKGLVGEFVTQVADVYLNFKSIHGEDINPMFPDYIDTPDDDGPLVLLKHEPDEVQAFLLMMTMEMYSTMLNSYAEHGANDN